MWIRGVTLSQQLLSQLNLLQEELLHRFSILQVWKLQDNQQSATGSRTKDAEHDDFMIQTLRQNLNLFKPTGVLVHVTEQKWGS